MLSKESSTFLQSHGDLVSDRNHALGQSVVVLEHQPDGDHDVINIMKDKGVL